MIDLDCRNELSLRERRGELSASERVALDAHLTGCGTCRLSRLLGRDFETGSTLEPGDGASIAGFAANASRWAEGQASRSFRSRRRHRAPALLVAASLALAAVGASAAGGVWILSLVEEKPGSSETPTAVSPPATAPEEIIAKIEPRRAALTDDAVAPGAPAKASRVASRAATAVSVFKEASDARREGDAGRAIGLYKKLQADFPSSPEAGLSQLPLGGLLLDRGQAQSALAQFDRYLAASRSAALAPEALYGRGRALAVLGRSGAEEHTWQDLLERFKTSPYAVHARRRLSQLTQAEESKTR